MSIKIMSFFQIMERICFRRRDFVLLADIHEEEDFFQGDAGLDIPPLVVSSVMGLSRN